MGDIKGSADEVTDPYANGVSGKSKSTADLMSSESGSYGSSVESKESAKTSHKKRQTRIIIAIGKFHRLVSGALDIYF